MHIGPPLAFTSQEEEEKVMRPVRCAFCDQPAIFRCSVCFRSGCSTHLTSRARYDHAALRRRFRLYCPDCDPGPGDP